MTSLGKVRHLNRCTSGIDGGHFLILAIDHRDNLRATLNQYLPKPMTDSEFTSFKYEVLRLLADEATAVLIDPDYGMTLGVRLDVIRASKGLLAPLEVTNYDVHPSQREVQFIPDWSVRKIKRAGGDGVKLLLYYHPDAPNAEKQLGIVRRIVDECGEEDIPFFLEPITYSLDPAVALPNADLRQITVAMTKTFSDMGVDVLKLQFPVDAAQSRDESEWRAACAEVTAAAGVPWALLSGGVDFDTFALQTQIACESGASGVIVGRAIWNEAVKLVGGSPSMSNFLATKALERMRILDSICDLAGTMWNRYGSADESEFLPGWYRRELPLR